ncbi:hypothetical protein [Acidocella aromatica]|uniref:Uncharacterized protein YjeT (DUF2065 family) n=1 Tax=Acidocella aromatica TaxID=1303579 RepID=A0A840VCA1_9PROT|nr:hypothetical protein [Acidocella aromatica]MBB5372477.1 uncharacterized protein YjeT (DUF2065 family) [Acidocella aromatica]
MGRALLRALGMVLIVIGAVPMTPLIWLLVFVHGNPYGIFSHIHLAFWQTQFIGLGLVGVGIVLLMRA